MIRHPIYDLGRGKEAGIRLRETAAPGDVVAYKLTAEDADQWPGLVLHWLAYHAYGRADLWERIADVNPIKPPWAWKTGDVVLLPRRVLQKDARGGTSGLAALVRQFR